LVSRSSTSSIAIIAPRPRTSPTSSYFSAEAAETVREDVTDRASPRSQVVGLHRLDRRERGGAGHRVAAVGAAETTGVDRVHDVRAPRDGRERHTPGDALGGR
jgi:hypothetical protein